MKNRQALALTSVVPRDARDFAISVIGDVIHRRLALDDRLEKLGNDPAYAALSGPDRGLTRAIATSAIRGYGFIRSALTERLRDGLPPRAGALEPTLIAAAAQILFLEVPDYAAVATAIDKLRADPRSERYAALANAILRGIGRDAGMITAADPLAVNTPGWLAERWSKAYGPEVARAIARAHLETPPLDLNVKAEVDVWSERLGGHRLGIDTIRLESRGPVTDLPGFAEGAWWVQDFAASIPVKILDPRPGETILDLCAAPGGKTAQIAAAGAQVIAVDRSAARLKRLQANLARLGLDAETHVADALAFTHAPVDAILLDAPCSATGTLRRHPDVAWSKTLSDVAALADLQHRLLDHAWKLLKPGGRLVFATCSLEPEEGENQIAAFLERAADAAVQPVQGMRITDHAELFTAKGYFRALPCHLPSQGGLDGFFSAQLVKS